MILMLEDNLDKVQALMYTYRDVIGKVSIFITGYQSSAETWIRNHTDRFVLFLDGELYPGAGTGLGFLVWLIEERKLHWLDEIVITTMSPSIKEEMIKLCIDHKIKYRVYKL